MAVLQQATDLSRECLESKLLKNRLEESQRSSIIALELSYMLTFCMCKNWQYGTHRLSPLGNWLTALLYLMDKQEKIIQSSLRVYLWLNNTLKVCPKPFFQLIRIPAEGNHGSLGFIRWHEGQTHSRIIVLLVISHSLLPEIWIDGSQSKSRCLHTSITPPSHG